MYIICHYSEIGLKGKNRKFFENTLCENIKSGLKKNFQNILVKTKILPGRILLELTNESSKKKIKHCLECIFGIAYFSFVKKSTQNIEEIQVVCLKLIKESKNKSFRITTKRSNKKFPLSSQLINEKIGAFIAKETSKKVKLKSPGINCYIEVVNQDTYIYTKKIKGLKGLPVGVSNKALVLISGGIDSPVAAYYSLKRGIQINFLHFHSLPYTSKSSINKVKRLVEVIEKFGAQNKLYLFPFADIQKQIMIKAPEKLRIILYRRIMMRIAEKLAAKENYLALVTGESVGQVASQTLENMRAIEEPTRIPVLRPLSGFDKEEIIEKAYEIKTYEISILPHEDCCVRFMPVHPETKAKLFEIYKIEEKLNIEDLIKKGLDQMN